MRKSGDGKVEHIVCHTDREGMTREGLARNDANAQLVASAPEMLAALEALLPLAEFYHDDGPEGEGWQSAELVAALDGARAAILKAKGGAA